MGCGDKRTYSRFTEDDLKEMQRYAKKELKRFLEISNGKYSVYEGKLIAICLCQGAAQHFVDKKTGIKDIDIWVFFEEDESVKIPHRRNMRKSECIRFKNLGEKRVDWMKKMINKDIVKKARGRNPEDIFRAYLKNPKTQTARFLSKKSVVGLFPDEILGKVIWK